MGCRDSVKPGFSAEVTSRRAATASLFSVRRAVTSHRRTRGAAARATSALLVQRLSGGLEHGSP